MLRKFLPNEHVKSIFDIHPDVLKEKGIKGIITDLDNTLVAWDVKEATSEVVQWFKLMKEHGIKVTIISNNNQERVKVFSEPLDTPFVFSARKPLSKAFRTTAKKMGLKKEEIVVVGDQILTDVLGGNFAGFYTILVVPIVQTDGKITRFNRRIERRILSYMRKKGKISWEE
ncbi:MAG: YqeG family HAD IIIA-type phosphatase [Bacillota bacterium]|uniref:YqeG family HAD IIIA-type phosphatase n=1 Tax=Virgibacillus salarius TaxID=447199 RepID=A0A941I9Z9_9BACI|nr:MULTISPECIES: YqeG family HAD IIIA-type phosphatase [Bacillaceae]NAZ10024.1 YqeG family HAD IIIA-type phosphatase [Agaribacter marinus]MBR7797314.1 YqeG family HAD IIIA-type phosphatase [Virgibacillus salarius]MCC2250234.1 YqeG family HAD IIIA-type phosphatase [Virgibacillus sp. AGTR]MDY7044599.1 YqeG family HAD IIIA-type phosphatase [Virgibacillus sp. M23]QRZ17484.1 YqeG family HAD IIIA-type phosphatase [Virgibacillus sp. AGTR]